VAGRRDDLATLLGLPIKIKNDINLATLGEQWLGVACGISAFPFLSTRTGEGPVLMSVFYGLRSSLDSVFASVPAQLGRRLTLSFGDVVSPGRRGVNS